MVVHMVVLREVVLQAMVFDHMVRKRNYLHVNKRKTNHGLRLNTNYPRPSFKSLKLALA
jgi:hypothetical protein